ncbi:hypothetical protein ABT230_000406 [Providencia rettgeri]
MPNNLNFMTKEKFICYVNDMIEGKNTDKYSVKPVMKLDSQGRFLLGFEKYDIKSKTIQYKIMEKEKIIYLQTRIKNQGRVINLIENNSAKLLQYKKYFYISKDKFVYEFKDPKVMDEIYTKNEGEMKKLFLRCVFELNEVKKDEYERYRANSNVNLSETEYLDYKYNPEKSIVGLTHKNLSSNYDHHIVIQLGSDEITADVISGLYVKHSKNTTLVQFDLESRQARILKSAIEVGENKNIRWTFVGHGLHVNNTHDISNKITFEGALPEEFAEGVSFLKNNILKDSQPNKIVLYGCNLARGSINENFTLNTHLALNRKNINIPMVGYNREIAARINYVGEKAIYIEGKEFSTKNFKYEYKTHPSSKKTYINGVPAPLFFINEVRRGELKISQISEGDNTNFLEAYKKNGEIDSDLIKILAFNNKANAILESELKGYENIIDDDFYDRIYQLLVSTGIEEPPLWRMVNDENINNQVNKVVDDGLTTIILRLNGSESGRLQAEQIASNNPKNTLIMQVGKDVVDGCIEYGDINKLTGLKQKKWVLITSELDVNESLLPLTNLMKNLREEYNSDFNDSVSLFLTDNPNNLTSEGVKLTSKKLKNILTNTGLYEPNKLTVNTRWTLNDKELNDNERLEGLILKLINKKMVPSQIDIEKDKYIIGYITHDDGKLNYEKISMIRMDPIVNKRVMSYFKNEDNVKGLKEWNNLFQDNARHSLVQQAQESIILLEKLRKNPEIITYLSEPSKNRLKSLFSLGHGYDHKELSFVISSYGRLEIIKNRLQNLIYFHQEDNKVFNNSSLKKAYGLMCKLEYERKLTVNYVNEMVRDLSVTGYVKFNEFYYKGKKTVSSLYNFYFKNEKMAEECRNIYEEIKNKHRLGNASSHEMEILKNYNDIYQLKNEKIEKIASTLSNQSFEAIFNQINNDYLVCIKSPLSKIMIKCEYKVESYTFHLMDESGIELVISDPNLAIAQAKLLKITQHYMQQELEQADGSVITRGKQLGFLTDQSEGLRATASYVDASGEGYRILVKQSEEKLETTVYKKDLEINKNTILQLGELTTSINELRSLGAMIDNVPIHAKHTEAKGWGQKIKFNADVLVEKLTLSTELEADIKSLKVTQQLIKDSNVEQKIHSDVMMKSQQVALKQLKIIQKLDFGDKRAVSKGVKSLHKEGIKLPVYARIANGAGQVTGGVGVFMTLNGIYQLIDGLDNPDLTEDERSLITKKLTIACASACFNYGDMILQPILLRLSYKQAGSFNSGAKLAARVTIIFNLIGIGLDIYQACEAFEQLDKITDAKERQDLLVNGSLSIANIVVGSLTIIGIIIGSSTIPVVGLIVGGVLLIGGMVYTGIRAVERIEEELGSSLDWDEKAREGIRAAFGFSPSDDILNRISYKQHLAYFKNINWQQDLDNFKSSNLYQGFEEHLQFVGEPILVEHKKYYIYYRQKFSIINSSVFEGADDNHILKNIARDDTGPHYTIEQINYIRSNYDYDSQCDKWIKVRKQQGTNEVHFCCKYSLIKKKAAISYKDIGEKKADDILILNTEYNSDLLKEFLYLFKLNKKYESKKKQPVVTQLSTLVASELRFFRARNHHSNIYHPDAASDVPIEILGDQIISDPIQIAKKILGEVPEVIYEGMKNIGLQYEKEAKQKNINFNSGNGTDITIGKKNARNSFTINSGTKFLAGGNHDDVTNLSLLFDSSSDEINDLYFDGNGGDNTLIIKDILIGSYIYIDLNSLKSKVTFYNKKQKDIILRNISNILLVGSRDSKAILKGNDESNTLDAASACAFIDAMGGDDQLLFEHGVINGGEGNDSYFLRRFDWGSIPEDEVKKTFNLTATITETTKSRSRVTLGYLLSEIEEVYVSGNDLIIIICSKSSSFKDKIVSVKVELKNVYSRNEDIRRTNHQYQLHTKDGFILNSKLKDLDEKKPLILKEDIFDITYQQNQDAIYKYSNGIVNINDETNTLSIGDRIYTPRKWGGFKLHGFIRNLTYQGSSGDNQLLMVNRNSRIIVTEGQDFYQVSPEQYFQGKLVFDYSNINKVSDNIGSTYISLPYENGFGLKVIGQSILLYNRFDDIKLEIKLINYSLEKHGSIRIQDGNNNYFHVEFSKKEQKIVSAKTINLPTEQDDYIHIPMGYQFPFPIIDASDGNDFIKNDNITGYIINAGKGNDIVVVTSGANVLYGGEGNDHIYGGDQNDLFLSDLGNDILDGKGGDDHYLVNGDLEVGQTTIHDASGENHIHLFNFKSEYEVISEDDVIFHLYKSKSNLRSVKIKVLPDSDMNINHAHHYDSLPTHLPNYAKKDMGSLIRYLAEQRKYKNDINLNTTWQPMDEFKGTLNGWKPLTTIDFNSMDIRIPENSTFSQLVVKTKGAKQNIWDRSGDGRVFYAEADEGGVSVPDKTPGNNAIYASKGKNDLSAGDGDDVYIINGANGLLTELKGKNSFLINGEIEGWNAIHSLGGDNIIHLIGFDKKPTREEPNHLSNATQFIYQSKLGRRVTILQYPNTKAPEIRLYKSLGGQDELSIQQKLEYLANTLAGMRIQDEISSFGCKDIALIQAGWDPVKHVESYMRNALLAAPIN